ncbi:MAG: peptidase [Alphaproteobacteria bacterium]|nr:peptidase [Alphaproteobacteria bacterium]
MLAQGLILFVLPALLVAAAAYDAASFTIPNRIQAGLLAAFVTFSLAVPLGTEAFAMHVLAGFVGLAIGFTLFALGYVGGGDAKLFACVTLWLGLSSILDYAITASLFGGLLTLMLLALRRIPLPQTLAAQGWIARLHDHRSGIPYGIALSLAALTILPHTDVFARGLG